MGSDQVDVRSSDGADSGRAIVEYLRVPRIEVTDKGNSLLHLRMTPGHTNGVVIDGQQPCAGRRKQGEVPEPAGSVRSSCTRHQPIDLGRCQTTALQGTTQRSSGVTA